MCGISGFVSDRRMNGSKMVASLSHRGPDYTGELYDIFQNKQVYLGHNRLSIIDLSNAGNQPIATRDGQVVIIYNGEVYNFQALKQKHLKEYDFLSKTDTEVILYLYEKLGIEFVNELNGDFAICLFDKRNAKLFLIRDRVGVKPLYYYFDDGTLVFGSEIKSILAAGVLPQFAQENLQNYFVFKYSPADETLFKGIKRISPASYLEYDFTTHKITLKKYWSLKKKEEYEKIDYSDAQRILYELVQDATRIRLMSDVPVGTFLSGGLDSSTIAYFLKNNKDITHYCASKTEADTHKEGTTSDYYYADKLSKDWNLNLVKINIGREELTLEAIKNILYYSDDLIADGSQIPSYLITKEAGKKIKVMLSGMGADELFLGYAGHQLTLLSFYLDKFPNLFSGAITGLFKSINQGKGIFLAYRRYLHKIGKYYSYPNYKYAPYNIVGDFENSCSVFKGEKENILETFSGYFPDRADVFDSLAHFELENFLVKNLHYADRMSMANSVECRVPFLDHRLIEFAYSIPRSYKLSNFGKSKKILKDTFQSHLPNYVLQRRKAGFGMPLRSIFSSQQTIDKLFDKNFFTNFNGFSVADIDRIIANHLSGREDNSSIIFSLIMFQEWYKSHF